MVSASLDNFYLLLLILARVSGIFIFTPVLGSLDVPLNFKIVMSFFISLVMFPVVASMKFQVPFDISRYMIVIINQVLIGLVVGYTATVLFNVFQTAGELFSTQMGFGIANVMDPIAQVSVPITGEIISIFATIVFLGINGHHMIIRAVYKSFSIALWFPFSSAGSLALLQVDALGILFETAFKIALPIMSTLFIVTVAEGILAKVAPQMNIMMVGFPLRVAVGLISMLLIMPVFGEITTSVFDGVFDYIEKFLFVLGTGAR